MHLEPAMRSIPAATEPSGTIPTADRAHARNRQLFEQEYAQRAIELSARPLALGVILGHRCNLNCIMCGQRTLLRRLVRRGSTEVTPGTLDDLYAQLGTCEWLHISGGEPLVYAASRTLADAAAGHSQVRIEMLTNGNLIDEAWVARICSGTFGCLAISVDAASADTYHRIRRGGRFAKVLAATREIAAHRISRDAPRLRWSFVVMRHNRNEILPFVELAHRHGVDELVLSLVGPQRISFYQQDPVRTPRAARMLLRIIGEAEQLMRRYGIAWTDRVRPGIWKRYAKLRPDRSSSPTGPNLRQHGELDCPAFWRKLVAEADHIWACCWSRPEFRRIPYDPQRQSLANIWNGAHYQRARKLMAARRYDEVCRPDCPIFARWRYTRGTAP